VQAGCDAGAAHGLIEAVREERLLGLWSNPGQPLAQQLGGLLPQRHHPLLAAFAM